MTARSPEFDALALTEGVDLTTLSLPRVLAVTLHLLTRGRTEEARAKLEDELADHEAYWRTLTHPMRPDDVDGDGWAPAWWGGEEAAAEEAMAGAGGIAGLGGVQVPGEPPVEGDR